jgi:hypothetical protein
VNFSAVDAQGSVVIAHGLRIGYAAGRFGYGLHSTTLTLACSHPEGRARPLAG